MKYCQGLHETDRLYDKFMDMEVKSWATAQEIIKKYAQSQALKAELGESTPKNQGHIVMKISGDSGPSQRSTSRSPGGQRKKYDPGSKTGAGTRQRLIPHMEGGDSWEEPQQQQNLLEL